MTGPSVSVVITTFNQASYIGATLESVLRQTQAPSEIVVVDDGSTDGTAEIVNSFGPRVIYVHQENRGVAGSRNTGVSLAKGDLIALLDGDDLWHPQKLEIQLQAYTRHPDAGIVAVQATSFETAGPDQSLLAAHSGHSWQTDCRNRLADLIERNFIWTTSAVMLPARVLKAVGPSDDRYSICSDYDLYLRVAARWPVAVVDLTLCFWRYLPSSSSGPRELRALRWSPEQATILRRLAHQFPPPLARQARRRATGFLSNAARLAYDYGVDADRAYASRYLRELVKRSPTDVAPWLRLAALTTPPPMRRWATAVHRFLRRYGPRFGSSSQ